MKDPLEQALTALPHGPEFRFLDRLLSLDPGKAGTAEYDVPMKSEFLKGHFPGHPMFPGVLMLEAAAQLAGVVAQSDPDHLPLADLRLTAVRGAKMFGAAEPGTRLLLAARVTGRLGPLIQAEVTVSAGDTLLCQTSLTLSGVVQTASRAD